MPKLKTKSSAKKRFRLTKTGQVHRTQAGKRHGMVKRDERQKRDRRGTTLANPTVAAMIRAMFPYGSR